MLKRSLFVFITLWLSCGCNILQNRVSINYQSLSPSANGKRPVDCSTNGRGCGERLSVGNNNNTFSKTVQRDHVKRVHIVYMNHLDVGYADFVNNILHLYFHKYFPLAASVANELSAKGFVETFIYTTHPWLVSLYMDCPPDLVLAGIKLQCPNATEKASFETAVKNGFITWHAGPMNLQMEMAEPWLLEYGFNLSMDLDKKFNITRKYRALSQRDVPGMTIGALPVLKKSDIIAVSVGVNNMSPPPAVPPLFVWELSGIKIMGNWHPGGYPDDPGSSPSHPGGLSRHDCVVIEGFSEALCFAFRSDNTGPPGNIQEVLGYYEILRAEFPDAELKASRLEEFFEAAMQIKDLLPIFTAEIGDTWISGPASDPRRVAEYRAVSRVLGQCLAAGECSMSDERVWNASRFLLKVVEHTWGLYTAGDNIDWSNDKFHPVQYTRPSFISDSLSWEEQREFVYLSVDSLGMHPIVNKITEELNRLKANLPDLTGYVKVANINQNFTCTKSHMTFQFGTDGSLVYLQYKDNLLVTADYPLGVIQYSTYNETDIRDFEAQYMYGTIDPGFDKNNISVNAHPESKVWPIVMSSLYANNDDACQFYAAVQVTDATAHTCYGAPEIFYIRYNFSNEIEVDLQWFNKTATRIPESLYMSFNLLPRSSGHWSMMKVAAIVDPHDVLVNGSQHHHGIGAGVAYTTTEGIIEVLSPDVAVVSPIIRTTSSQTSKSVTKVVSAYPVPLYPIRDEITGMSFNLFNNVWETNWIFWYPYMKEDKDFLAHFRIRFT